MKKLVAAAALCVLIAAGVFAYNRIQISSDPIGLSRAESQAQRDLENARAASPGPLAMAPLRPGAQWKDELVLEGQYHRAHTGERSADFRMGFRATVNHEVKAGDQPGTVAIRHSFDNLVIHVDRAGLSAEQITLAEQDYEGAAPLIMQSVVTEIRDDEGRRIDVTLEVPSEAQLRITPAMPLFLAMIGETPTALPTGDADWQWQTFVPDFKQIPLVARASSLRTEEVGGKSADLIQIESVAQYPSAGAAQEIGFGISETNRVIRHTLQQMDLRWTQQLHRLHDSGVPLVSMGDIAYSFWMHHETRRPDQPTSSSDSNFEMNFRVVSRLVSQ